MVPLWLGIAGLVWLGLYFNVDRRVIAGSVVVIGILSNAFAWLVGVIALVPIVGPLIVKILSVGFVWLLNAVGYLVAVVAIRRGYSKDVLTYRGLTIALIIGIVIGFIIGKEALGGMLAGATLAGVLLALMMSNGGGAWDNAKKYIEKGELAGEEKGGEAHNAAVIGDTVGDPFKDTSGPAMNSLIKLMSVVSLVIAPLLV